MSISFEYINTTQKLAQAVAVWKQQKILAIDLECENNLHHYGTYLSLIQISSAQDQHWIVDILAFRSEELKDLVAVLEDSAIEKVFHDVSFDLRMLNFQCNASVKNLFDTQIAVQLLGKTTLGLGSLLEEYFGVHKVSKFQKADWTKRPLSRDMLSYAIKDTAYLLQLRNKLAEELEAKGRTAWMHEEMQHVESLDWEFNEPSYDSTRGFSALESQEQMIFKELYGLRSTLAQELDKPVHFVIRNKLLLELARHPPHGLAGWKRLGGVHKAVRHNAQRFVDAVETGNKMKNTHVKKQYKKFSSEQKQAIYALTEEVGKVALSLGISRHLIANKDQIREIVLSGSYECLRNWQRELLGK